jgi:hypothetical protein
MEKNPMRPNGEYLALALALVLLGGTAAYAEIVEYEGPPDALSRNRDVVAR